MGWVFNATTRPFYPRKRPGTHCIGGWVGPTAGLDGCGKSRLLPGFDPRTAQPVSNHYTYSAVPAPILFASADRIRPYYNFTLPKAEFPRPNWDLNFLLVSCPKAECVTSRNYAKSSTTCLKLVHSGWRQVSPFIQNLFSTGFCF